MDTQARHQTDRGLETAGAQADRAAGAWQTPRFEVISLCCEITAYAPDDEPLF